MRLRRTQAFVFTATFVTIGMMTGCSSAISGTSSTPAPETASPTVSVDPRVAALCTEFDAALQATYLNPTFRATANARKVPAQIKTVLAANPADPAIPVLATIREQVTPIATGYVNSLFAPNLTQVEFMELAPVATAVSTLNESCRGTGVTFN